MAFIPPNWAKRQDPDYIIGEWKKAHPNYPLPAGVSEESYNKWIITNDGPIPSEAGENTWDKYILDACKKDINAWLADTTAPSLLPFGKAFIQKRGVFPQERIEVTVDNEVVFWMDMGNYRMDGGKAVALLLTMGEWNQEGLIASYRKDNVSKFVVYAEDIKLIRQLFSRKAKDLAMKGVWVKSASISEDFTVVLDYYDRDDKHVPGPIH